MPGARDAGADDARRMAPAPALVSGGFTAFTRHVQALCGFDLEEANELEIADGRLTGRLVGELRGAEAKLAALERLRGELGLAARADAGRGRRRQRPADAAGRRAGRRVPRPSSACARPHRCGSTHGDLTALLFLQGYRRDEFVRRPGGYALKRSATKRRSPWRSISSRIDFLPSCWAWLTLADTSGGELDLLLADLDDQVARLAGSPRPPVEPSATSVITTPLAVSGRLNCVRCSALEVGDGHAQRARSWRRPVGDGASCGGPSSATLLVLGQLAQRRPRGSSPRPCARA